MSLTCGQRSDLAEAESAQPTTHSARAEVLWKTRRAVGGLEEEGTFLSATSFGLGPTSQTREGSGGQDSLQFGGSQWHRTARGSPRVTQRRGRRVSSTSLRVPGHPCLPSRLRVPRGSLPGRAGPSAGRQGGREGRRGGPGGRLAAYRLLLLDPRHAAAVTEPGSGE